MNFFCFNSGCLFCFAIAGLALSGCDLGTYAQRVESTGAKYQYQAPIAKMDDAKGGKRAGRKMPGEGSPALGSWAINQQASIEATRKIFKPVPGQPQVTLAAVESLLSGTKLTFTLKPDMSFTCVEVVQSRGARYRGTWKLTRDRIELNQTHRGDVKEKDSLVGTLSGDTMDTVHERDGLKMGFVLERAR